MPDSAIGSIAWLALVIAYVVTVWRMARVAWSPTDGAHVAIPSMFDRSRQIGPTISVERDDRRPRTVGAR